MAEFHFFHVYPCHPCLPVALYHQSEVTFIDECRRSVDVLQRGYGQAFRQRVCLHLAWMCHEDDEALVPLCEVCQQVEECRDILRFRLSARDAVFQPVERVQYQYADAPPPHQLACPFQYRFYGEIFFGQDARNVFRQIALRFLVEHFGHQSLAETLSGQFFGQFGQVIGEGLVFGAEISCPPLVVEAAAQHQFVRELRFSVARVSRDDAEPSGLEGAEVVQVLQSRFRSP